MATQRRIVSEEKTHLDQDEMPKSSSVAPAVPTPVIVKLLAFTFAMITLPITTYFVGRDYLFGGASAAIVANVVLIGYVVVAFREDQADREQAEIDSKKSR